MKSTCVSHPANERLVIIRKWQVEFCEGNQCAAALLSFFEYWHSWKLNAESYNRKTNNIAEFHGEARSLPEDVFQYHTLLEMTDGILGLYGQKKISEAIKLLATKSAITIHVNPNPKFCHDKTQYFKFYPEICNEWLKSSYKSGHSHNAKSTTQKSSLDNVDMRDTPRQNATRDGNNAVYRTEINNKDINISINTCDDDLQKESNSDTTEHSDLTQLIVDALIEKGMACNKFFPDSIEGIQRLHLAGATISQFVEGYDIAFHATKGGGFGINYLIKTVDSLLVRSKKSSYLQVGKSKTMTVAETLSAKEPAYENDFKNAQSWAGDLL